MRLLSLGWPSLFSQTMDPVSIMCADPWLLGTMGRCSLDSSSLPSLPLISQVFDHFRGDCRVSIIYCYEILKNSVAWNNSHLFNSSSWVNDLIWMVILVSVKLAHVWQLVSCNLGVIGQLGHFHSLACYPRSVFIVWRIYRKSVELHKNFGGWDSCNLALRP